MTTADVEKHDRLEWLRRVYSNDAEALTPEQDAAHLFETMEGWGAAQFVATYRPLTKLIEARGPISFTLQDIEHAAPDVTYANLRLDGEILFVLYVRFEAFAPYRVRYWNSYPPLPDGVTLRSYTPEDADGCVALERACPMELEGGATWIIDRGEQFDNYLQLMGEIDAAVLVAGEQVVGFYSCALRPVHFNGADTSCVYQHHYRVHPDYRSGSVSQALAAFIDPGRSFETAAPQFPYAMIDPKNVHMRNMGFPGIEGVTIARLAVPVDPAAGQNVELSKPDSAEICALLNSTHEGQVLYKLLDEASLSARCNTIATYGEEDFFAVNGAVMGVWRSGERNVLTHGDQKDVYHLAFALDYGFRDTACLMTLIDAICPSLAEDGITHLCFLCDTRAPEFAPLSERAGDVERFGFNTLPFLAEAFQCGVVYCDGVYC